MDFLLILIAVILVVGFFGLFIFIHKKTKTEKPQDISQPLLLLQNQINEIARTLDNRLHQSSKELREQMTTSSKASQEIIKEVTKELTKVGEGHKQVISITDQLKSLKDILQNPKQRGILGEYYLETVLKNVLPPQSYQMQYEFKDGVIVDAAIFIKEQIIPIDSKFSLENYNRVLEAKDDTEREKYEQLFSRDLKTRIDETSKYIKPGENTMDFAFMFIPAEAIYYDLLINKVGAVKSNTRDLIHYAYDKKVVIISPTSFLAYLQTVLQGLRYQQAEQSVQEIIKKVMELGKHLGAYDSYFQKLGNHLGTTVSMYNSASKELKKIDKDVLKIGGQGIGLETNLLEKPASVDEFDNMI